MRTGPRALARLLSVCGSGNVLTTIDLQMCERDPTSFDTLAKLINVSSSLTSLSLSGPVMPESLAAHSRLGAASLELLSKAMMTNLALAHLSLRQLQLDGDPLAVLFSSSINLLSLDVSPNQLDEVALQSLTEFLRGQLQDLRQISSLLEFCSLSSLCIEDCGLVDDELTILTQCLRTNDRLWISMFKGNSWGDSATATLCEALRINPPVSANMQSRTLLRLSCSHEEKSPQNSVGEAGAFSLGLLLKTNPSWLTEVDLSYNQISPEGLAAICRGLHHSTNLRYLDLRANFWCMDRDEGAEAIGILLLDSSALQALHLGSILLDLTSWELFALVWPTTLRRKSYGWTASSRAIFRTPQLKTGLVSAMPFA
jgi:hypothetical protein